MKILALGTSCVDVYPQKGVGAPGGEPLNISAHLSFRGDVELMCLLDQLMPDFKTIADFTKDNGKGIKGSRAKFV
jgi:hypothetical protein